MTEQSTLLQERFESALQAYRKVTGVTLTEHPLAVQSVGSITTILKHEAQASSDFLGTDEIIKSIENTVPVLSALSSTISIGEAIGLVCQNKLMGCCTFLTVFFSSTSPLRKQYLLASLSYLLYMPFSCSHVSIYHNIQIDQVAKHTSSSCDGLVGLVEFLGRFIRHVEIYTWIPPTPAMDEIAFNIMLALLSTLALATKELKQGRSSESLPTDVIPHLTECSKICGGTFQRSGRRGGPAEAGTTHGRRDSDCRASDSYGCVQSHPKY